MTRRHQLPGELIEMALDSSDPRQKPITNEGDFHEHNANGSRDTEMPGGE